MQQKLRLLRESPFVRHNVVFFVGSLGIAFLNYLYYPVMGRLLDTVSFGELQVLISFFMVISLLLSVMSLVSVNIVARAANATEARHTLAQLEKATLYAGLVIALLILALAEPLRGALKFTSVWPFIVMAITFLVSVPGAFRQGYLRGKNDFVHTSWTGIVGALVKLVASALLVLVGLQVTGASSGLLAAQVATVLYAGYHARRLGERLDWGGWRLDWGVLRLEGRYAGYVLGLSLITTLLVSLDVTLVKYLFSPEDAGRYAGVATIARIVYFLTGSIAAVLLSSVGMQHSQAHNRQYLQRSLLLTLVLGGSATLWFCLLPGWTMHLLLGTKYDAFVHLLPALSGAILATSLTNVYVTYNMALRRYGALAVGVCGSAATAAILILRHDTVDHVVYGFLIGSGLMLASFVLWDRRR